MCNVCETDLVEVVGDETAAGPDDLAPPPPPTDLKKLRKKIRRESLERNAARPEPWPVCDACRRPVHPGEVAFMFGPDCECCGLDRLDRAFRRLIGASRRDRRRCLRRIARLARLARSAR